MSMTGASGLPLAVDKAAMRKAQRTSNFEAHDTIRFDRVGEGPHRSLCADWSIQIDPRTGDRWRVTIHDTSAMGEDVCYVADLHTDTTSPIELLRLALNDYREHQP
ncbi:hypothetical protein [Gordonia sp. (in: high G+C Gram-positive bacteria)]|uniref:hypothetical protein n=1 Tax=Gordonia sp. (in: high G+C Gram-positive bacteria) TaxID=84139 RepID=UPI003341CC30